METYIEQNNLQAVDETKREIIDLYEEDFVKIDGTGLAGDIYDAVPASLSGNASRYVLSNAREGIRSDRVRELIPDMLSSFTVNIAYHANNPEVGMSLEKDAGRYKLFLSDVGLFVTLIYKDKNCVITTDAYGSYTILYYNVKQLKYKYFYKSEEAINEDELEDIFEDKKYLEMVYKLNDIENGVYNIKKYCLNKNHGSLINEWIRFGKDQMIDTEDALYLKDIAQPAIRRKTIHVENHTLIFKQVMPPNEIGLIKIYKK